MTDSHAFQLGFYTNSTAQPGSNHSYLLIYKMSVYSMCIHHNFRYHRAKAEINNLAGAVLVRYTKGNAVGAYQYQPHLSIRSPSYWQITVVERYNTDGIRYPVPVITIFQSLLQGHPEKLPKDFRKMSLSDKLIKLQNTVSVNLIAFFGRMGETYSSRPSCTLLIKSSKKHVDLFFLKHQTHIHF